MWKLLNFSWAYPKPLWCVSFRYWSLLRNRALALTVWVGGSIVSRRCLQRKHTDLVKNMSLTLFTGRHLLRVRFVTGLESNLCTTLTRYNTTETLCLITELTRPHRLRLYFSIFLTGVCHLLVIMNRRSDLPNEPTTKVKVILLKYQYKLILSVEYNLCSTDN
jgi:hypothetical protein